MCVPFENTVYFDDGDGFNSNPVYSWGKTKVWDNNSGIILYMCRANERRYIGMLSLFGWEHTQNDPWYVGNYTFSETKVHCSQVYQSVFIILKH